MVLGYLDISIIEILAGLILILSIVSDLFVLKVMAITGIISIFLVIYDPKP